MSVCDLLIQIIGVFVSVCVAVLVLRYELKKREREATLEYYHSVSKEAHELRNKINAVFKKGAKIELSNKEENENGLKDAVYRFLSLYEQVSVGVNLGILDLEVFMRIMGRTFIRWYERLEPVIKESRKNGMLTKYGDFEELVNVMAEKYERCPKKYSPRTKYTQLRQEKQKEKQQ